MRRRILTAQVTGLQMPGKIIHAVLFAFAICSRSSVDLGDGDANGFTMGDKFDWIGYTPFYYFTAM